MNDHDDDCTRSLAHLPGLEQPDPAVIDRFETLTADIEVRTSDDERYLPDRLCHVARQVLSMDGAAITTHVGADIATPVGATGPDAARAESLQFSLREGPGLYCCTTGEAVLLADLGSPDRAAHSAWPLYAADFRRCTGYRAAFTFPLLCRDDVVGALSLYRNRPGPLANLPAATAIAASIAARLLAVRLITARSGHRQPGWLDGPTARRREQAMIVQGLIMHANRLSSDLSMELLRAHAYTAGRLVDDISEDILAGRRPVPLVDRDA